MKKHKPRRVSTLTATGNEAKHRAEAKLLLKTLRAQNWSLTKTAETLKMGHPSSVLAALTRYNLLKVYRREKKAAHEQQ